MNKRLGLLTALALGAAILLIPGAPAAAQGGCQAVHRPYATISDDGGQSFVPYRGAPITEYSLTWGLAATAVPGLVYMHAANALWVSENDGCTWTQFGSTAFNLFRIATGSGDVAYAWSEDRSKFFYRLEPNGGRTGYLATENPAPEFELVGFGVDANDSSHVRAVGQTGQIWESFEGGAATTWTAIGEPANPQAVFAYFAAFDPNDLDHVVFGQPTEGGFVTFDGGQSWDRSLFISDPRGQGAPPGQASDNIFAFTGVISPVDGNIVYARAVDHEQLNAGDPSNGRYVYLSVDGGASFVPAIHEIADGVPLPTQPLMVADSNDANVVHLVRSGSPFFGGTTFYRYDGSTDTTTSTTNQIIPIVRSITFSRQTPGRFIVGFEIVR